MIETLFPPGVTALAATPEMWSGALLPEEEACLSPRAVPKRRREFTAGRVCARAALARLGVRDFPILVAADRSPIWPEGIVGSLSHCGDYCGVAVARRSDFAGVGLDVERARPLQERVVASICTEKERRRLAALTELPLGLWAVIVFSAKEAFYKCVYPTLRTYLGYHDVEIGLDVAAGTFTASLAGRGASGPYVSMAAAIAALRGRFARTDAHVFGGATLPASGPGSPR